MSVGLSPTDRAFRMQLASLIRTFGREGCAAVLGVPIDNVQAWYDKRKPASFAARRLVWLVWVSFLHPGRVQNALDLVTWGKLRD